MTTYAGGRRMTELIRSNDHVLLSFVAALCEDHGIVTALVDSNISVMEGSIGAFPRRLLVDAERHDDARELLAEAEADPVG
ncbi:DUF2007 domain-containing protein [Nocardioides sp.]|uniref:putative signal transducing protein n=1 Tax=Nocardioides sp. TaxID=35761 RepID=UPI003529D35E